MKRTWLKEMAAKAVHEMVAEAKQMAAHGSHEVSAAIWNQNAFVMYPRPGSRDDQQVKPVEHEQTQQIDRDI